MRGPRETGAAIVIIVIWEPMFYLILHNIEQLCCIALIFATNKRSSLEPSHCVQVALGSVRTLVMIQ